MQYGYYELFPLDPIPTNLNTQRTPDCALIGQRSPDCVLIG